MTWKKGRPTAWLRVRNGWASGATVLLSTLAVIGFLLPFQWRRPGIVIPTALATAAVAVIVAWLKGHATAVPISLVEEIQEEERFEAAYCGRDQLQEACDMTKPYYGEEYVDGQVAEQWRLKNPTGFVGITNGAGELCACFGLLGLAEDFRKQFYAGNVADTRLRADGVLDPEATKSCSALYISGIVVRDPMTLRSGKRARVMLWALLQYYRDHFGFRARRTLYGLAANEESEKLFRTFEFTMVGSRESRVDRCNMFELEVDEDVWRRVERKVWNLSGICSTRWLAAGSSRR